MADDHDAPAASDSSTSDSSAAESSASADAKARFREALDRKHDTAHRSAEGRQNTGVVQGSEVTASAKRSFRRKTG